MEINRADVLADVSKAFTEYEQALVDGDNAKLVEFFWPAPSLVRFGLADQQSGFEQLRAWRLAQEPVPRGRRLFDTVITTYGTDFATATTLFAYGDEAPVGRQSQTWLRTPTGWQIASAHVSWAA